MLCYNKANYNKLDAMISKIEWEDEMRRNSVNDYWELIMQQLNHFKESCIPQFKRSIASDVPWLNSKLKTL